MTLDWLTHLDEMKIETDPNFSPLASMSYHLPLKHHQLVKEEIDNQLEAGLIEHSMSLCTASVFVFPCRNKPRAPLAKTKWLLRDYRELNK